MAWFSSLLSHRRRSTKPKPAETQQPPQPTTSATTTTNPPTGPPSELTSFPPFLSAPNPHGQAEFIRATIAEQSGTQTQKVQAAKDIQRVNQEALRRAKVSYHKSLEKAAASSLNALIDRQANSQSSQSQSRVHLNLARPPPSSSQTTTGQPPSKQSRNAVSPSRIPAPPRTQNRSPRHHRPSQTIDERLRPLGPMAARIVDNYR